jgi:hydroxymethylpyrimidine/phosphomethylpyrimidine kinase
MGCYPLSVVTALTVQDTAGVESFLAIDPDWVAGPGALRARRHAGGRFQDGHARFYRNRHDGGRGRLGLSRRPLVLDPVLASGAATSSPATTWSRRSASSSCRRAPWSPRTSPSCGGLAGDDEDDANLAECAQRLLDTGCEYVLVTGTHDSTPDVVNTLYHRGGVLRSDSWQRLPGSYHGSGCTLAAALAANLARGLEIGDAVYEAQDYTWHALLHAFRPGMGQHLPDRLFWARESQDEDGDDE